jgi:hypothetical protein
MCSSERASDRLRQGRALRGAWAPKPGALCGDHYRLIALAGWARSSAGPHAPGLRVVAWNRRAKPLARSPTPERAPGDALF